jgi:hypothetical protein
MPGQCLSKQRTFTIAPPPGMSSKSPRPPMTSKQAKKLYRQTTTPRVSLAEHRRIEAQERERIRREHERERAAEKAKAAREKKQKKANEAKEMRRKMGLPEPSRWVRASQRTIVGFISVVAGTKRAREQVSDRLEGNIGQSAAKRVALVQPEVDIELGTARVENLSPAPPLQAFSASHGLTQPEPISGTSPRPTESGKKRTGNLPNCILINNTDRPSEIPNTRPRIPLREIRNMPPPPIPAISKSVGPPSKKIIRPNTGRRQFTVTPPSSDVAYLEANLNISLPSPSKQVRELLEDISDIPSNTQVAREIDADDGHGVSRLESPQSQPANSVQLAKPLKSARVALSEITFKSATLLQESKPGASKVQIENDDLGLEFLSSQDLVISSQDLRDMNTPSRVVTPRLTHHSPQGYISIKKAESPPPPKTKPRFSEERDDDLLHAAIHESLRAIRQAVHKPSRWNPPPRSQHRVSSAASEYGDEDFEMGIGPELLAVLERAEMERR